MNKIRWNEQNPPVSTEAIAAIGCGMYGAHVLDKQGAEIGLFDDVKWSTTRHGPALCIGARIIGWIHPDRVAADIPATPVTGPVNMPDASERAPWVPGQYRKPANFTPIDMVRDEYFPCAWTGCDSGRCTVKQTEHARGFPTLFYVQCPECGAHGPECWEKSEAVKKWLSAAAAKVRAA